MRVRLGVRSSAAIDSIPRPQLRKEDGVANRGLVGQQHHQAVDADALATRRRHPVLNRQHEVIIHDSTLLSRLRFEPSPLFDGIVELGKCVGHFKATDEELETLHRVGVIRGRLGKGRDIPGKVHDEGGVDHQRFSSHFVEFGQKISVGALVDALHVETAGRRLHASAVDEIFLE